MHAREIRRLLRHQPFKPFTLRLSGGRCVCVNDPQHAGFSYDRASLGVALPAGGFTALDLGDITRVTPLSRPSR